MASIVDMTQSKQNPQDIEKQYVKDTYEIIANSFSNTRNHIWSQVLKYLKNFKSNSLVADIGCGNGRNIYKDNKCYYIGFDLTEQFVKITTLNTNCDGLIGNCINIPFKDNVFDYVINIAVLHHLASHERRLIVIKELFRILCKGGQLILSVWSLHQFEIEKRHFDKQENYVGFCNKQTGKTYQRYYYMFDKGELELLIEESKLGKVIETVNERGNWIILCEKI